MKLKFFSVNFVVITSYNANVEVKINTAFLVNKYTERGICVTQLNTPNLVVLCFEVMRNQLLNID